MAKAQSVVHSVTHNDDDHTVTVLVAHSPSASFRRSVIPVANRAFDDFMRTPQGKAWIEAGFARFTGKADFNGELAKIVFTVSDIPDTI